MRLRGEQGAAWAAGIWGKIIKVAKQFPSQTLACHSPPRMEFSRWCSPPENAFFLGSRCWRWSVMQRVFCKSLGF